MAKENPINKNRFEEIHRMAFDEEAAAESIGVSPQHLANLRKKGGIPFMKLGKRVLYPKKVLEQWLNKQCIQPIDPDDTKPE